MADGEKQGLDAALEIVGPGEAPLAPLQLPLRLTDGAADGEDMPDARADAPADEARGRGRPPGSRNKRTDAWVDYLLNRYRSPLVVLAEIYSRPVDELKKELNCDALEAFRLQLQAAEKLAPYVHQKQPVAVEIDPSGVVHLVLAAGAPEIGGGTGDDDDQAETLVIEGQVLDETPADANPDKSKA